MPVGTARPLRRLPPLTTHYSIFQKAKEDPPMHFRSRKSLTACLITGLGLAGAAWVSVARGHNAPDSVEPPPDAACVTSQVRSGAGDNTYESVPNWCQIPEGRKNLGSTHGGVLVDKNGNIYFSMDAGPQGILVYSPDGKMIRGFAEKFVGIHGMCLNDEDGQQYLYAAHLKGRQAVKMKLDGTVVWTIGFDAVKQSGKYEKLEQFSPTAIAVVPNGDVFIADGYGQNWVHQFDKNQKYVRSFGGKGKGDGQFNTCHGIALDKRGDKPLLLVCDRENHRLQHFDLDGKFVNVVWTDEKGRARPCSMSFHGDHIAIADLAGEVLILDGQNKLAATLGDNPDPKQRANFNVPPEQWKEGIFNAPHGISYDKDANLYVEDWNASGRISKMMKVKEGNQARAE
jgi:hypothetical protein